MDNNGLLIAIVAGGTLTLGGVAHAQPLADEPVISDEAFESRLPPLDPALGDPLEPIGDFEGPAAPLPAEPVPDAALPDPA